MLVFDKSKRTTALVILKFFIDFKQNTLRPTKRKEEQNEQKKADLGNKSAAESFTQVNKHKIFLIFLTSSTSFRCNESFDSCFNPLNNV
jgi:hypothetical protein